MSNEWHGPPLPAHQLYNGGPGVARTSKVNNRYEQIVEQLSTANEEEQKQTTPNTVNIINKHLLQIKNGKQRLLNEANREIRQIKNQNRVYKEHGDGKDSKQELRPLIEKREREQHELTQIELRKIKAERSQHE